MKRIRFVLNSIVLCAALIAGAALVVSTAGCSGEKESAGKGQARFHCPMHPTYVSERQGDCPICGMRLVPISQDGATGQSEGHSEPVAGRIAIVVSPEKRQTIGLATSPVERRSFKHTVRATGTVVHDETRLTRIAPRFAGWVRSLNVNFAGQPVEKGQVLFSAYSPELFTAETEYLLALQNARRLTNAALFDTEAARGMVETARRRLDLLQIGEAEIRELERRGQPSDQVQFRSPVAGHVLGKEAVEGKGFEAGETLYEIADLDHLWVRAWLFENELGQIKVGQKGRVIFPYLDNRTVESAVTFVGPHINPETRRAEVRLELDNPEHALRPEMWANVELDIDRGEALAIPASAVIDTGTRHIAFVDAENGHLEPREIKIASRPGDYLEVLDGLKEGEKVVSRALFLVDSESQLKSAIAGMTGSGGSAGHQH